MDLQHLLQSEEFWGWAIMLIYPKLFDLLEQLLQWLGLHQYIDTPTRKTFLAYVLAFPAAILALLLLQKLWPEQYLFEMNWVNAFTVAIASIVTDEIFTVPAMKARGVLKASIRPVKSLQQTRQEKAAA